MSANYRYAERACRAIIAGWHEQEAEAGQAAQQAQDPDAYYDVMERWLMSILLNLSDDLTPPLP